MFLKFLLLLSLCTLALAKSLIDVEAELKKNPLERHKRGSVCYGDLGCFDNGSPFLSSRRPISLLPQSPNEIQTKFYLYTRNDISGTSIPATNLSSISSSDFKASRATKMFVHGWQDHGLDSLNAAVKDALLEEGDYNVFLVDWQKGADDLYGQSTANTRVVGAQIAQFINYLEETKEASPADMHLIGHSLGAHTVGYAGERTPGLGRITGLDPAEPYFQYTDPVVRLDPTDADFVDVIHTDAASFYSAEIGLGMSQACGHADFYPNGGYDQPGCSGGIVSVIEGLFNGELIQTVSCNHRRALLLFTDSIKEGQCPNRAYQCNSESDFNNGKCIPCSGTGCGVMGYHADDVIPANGATNVKYYLNTGKNSPYCRFHYKVTLRFSSGKGEKQRGKFYVKLTGSQGATGMVALTEDPIYVNPGNSKTYIVTSPEDLGDVGKVEFRWEQKASLTDPSTWYVFSTPKVYLSGVDVHSGEAQKGFSFCAGDAKVNSKSSKEMNGVC